jgi:hypothetical protein
VLEAEILAGNVQLKQGSAGAGGQIQVMVNDCLDLMEGDGQSKAYHLIVFDDNITSLMICGRRPTANDFLTVQRLCLRRAESFRLGFKGLMQFKFIWLIRFKVY